MQRLEVSCAVRRLNKSLRVKGLNPRYALPYEMGFRNFYTKERYFIPVATQFRHCKFGC